MKQVFILILLIISISLNAKTKENLIKKDTTKIEDNNVVYRIYEDQNYLYLNISTLDKQTTLSIIRRGLTVYFDVKGKEKENVYLKYPINIEAPKRGLRINNNEKNTKINLDSIIAKIPNEAEYGFYENKVEFNKDLNSEDISLGFNTNGQFFEYSIKVPKTKILIKNKTDLSKLSIGIKSNEPERQNNQRPDESMRQEGGNRPNGGGRGGGMSGGRQGGNRGNQSGGNNRNERPTQKKTDRVEIDFWFDAKLNG